MIWLYRLILFCAPPFILVRLWFRSRKNPAYQSRLIERTGRAPTTAKPNGIWVHAVSVGEFIASTPLIEALIEQYPDKHITLTCTTPTASALIQKKFEGQLGSRIHHSYLPYDYRYFVNRFLNQMQPSLLIIMETEIWPNLLIACQQCGVRSMTANMRIGDKSINRYRYLIPLLKPILNKVDVFSVQTNVDRDRIIELGAKPESVTVTGNLKYDQFTAESILDAKLNDRLRSKKSHLWCAGSTHEGEDEIMLSVHAQLLDATPNALLVIAPRHPERFDKVYALAKARFNVQKWSNLVSETSAVDADTQVLLLDAMGELKRFIACAGFCFVGGSLVDIGGHNILESCHAGVPVLFGPHMQNFKQAKAQVIEVSAGAQVDSAEELASQAQSLLNDQTLRQNMGEAGLTLIKRNQGALARTTSLVAKILKR